MTVPDFSMTTLEAAMANTLAAVSIQVDQFNQQLKSSYLTTFNNWSINVQAGRIDNTNPPQPPNAYVIGYFTDSTNPNARWAYPMVGDAPVCDVPPVPPVVKPYVPPVLPEPDDIRNVPVGDTLPVGFILTAPDGSRWQKHSSHTLFGVAYYYARLS
jgi:hypothetical protein